MFKRFYTKKILFLVLLVTLVFLFSMFPKEEKTLDVNQNLNYISSNENTHTVFLLDKYDYVAMTSVLMDSDAKTVETKAKELIETLIIEGKNSNKVPNGFKPVIPTETKINDIKYENKLLHVDFSKELLNTNKEVEEKIIEVIIFTLTSIEEVDGVILYIDGNILTKLPKSNVFLPSILTRDFGVNKVYDIHNFQNINQVTVYYLSGTDENYYYVPVTKYDNLENEKIEVIIDELASGPIYQTNLMSFLNTNTKLLNHELIEKTLNLSFNEFIMNDINNKDILEEVMYTISLSIADNYKDVNDIKVIYKDNEIASKCLKFCK
ncbi:MAG: GerMN domain-containing protein [Bacilli bacterium]